MERCPRCMLPMDGKVAGMTRARPERHIAICSMCCTLEWVAGVAPVEAWPLPPDVLGEQYARWIAIMQQAKDR